MVPSVPELNEYAMDAYTSDLIQSMEMNVLNKLHWQLSSFTPLHFLGYYRGKGVLYQQDTMSGKPLVEKLPRYVRKYSAFFADLSLQEYGFQRYRPSLLAAAIVAASRKALHVAPLWRPELSALTGVAEAEMRPVFEHLWAHYVATFPTAHQKHEKKPSPKGVNEM